jgi:hypothetical protein
MNTYPCSNPYGNLSCQPYGYQGKNSLVKIKVGIPSGADATIANHQLGGVSVLSVNLRGYGNINYGSTVTSGAGGGTMSDANYISRRGNGVALWINETDPAQGKPCDGLCLQIPCGVNSFEVVTMAWNLNSTSTTDAWDSTEMTTTPAHSWVGVWHVDLTKCSVTAVSWTRVLNEDSSETCTSQIQRQDNYIKDNGDKYKNSTLTKCCCSCTSNCCTKITCPSDLDSTNCDVDCTNVLTLYSKACDPYYQPNVCPSNGCC